MPNRVTVTSRKGWLSRLSDSIKGILVGVFLFVVAFPLLFWNEGRAVRTAKSLKEGSGIVVSVSPDRVDPQNEGRLVHASAFVKTDEVLEDEVFDVKENAVKLARKVEMYQWVESQSTSSEKKLGGSEETTTTYDYSKEWRDELLDSSRFQSSGGHQNPASMPYEERTEVASSVALGAFSLSGSQIDQLRKSEALRVTALPKALGANGKLDDGAVYLGQNPGSPAVGDLRVRFEVVRPGPVSVVARQVGSTFEPYRAEAGGSIFLLEESIASADGMIEAAEAANTFATWMLRGVGFFLMFFGLSLVLRPLSVLGDVVPAFGNLLGAGVGLVAALIAAVCAFATIAFAWFVYRPFLAIVLLGLAAGAVLLLVRAFKRVAPAALPPLPPPIPTQARAE
jgi:Transmembrane protein 43